ncbi:Pol polyprotein, partial [Mucuna pruriens]
MGPFPISNGNAYILLAIDYVSRWVEGKATKTNNAKVVVDFVKSNIFCKFGVSKAIISDQGMHQITTAYHPNTNGQVEVFNREIRKLLQKMVSPSRNDWS